MIKLTPEQNRLLTEAIIENMKAREKSYITKEQRLLYLKKRALSQRKPKKKRK